jgi:5-methylcytosine-specific restriction protein A
MDEKKRNPPWDYDEIIIALDVYKKHFPKVPEKDSKEISELSQTLRSLAVRLGNHVSDNYRNVNGVYMKLMNFKALDPEYMGKGLASGSRKDKEVFEAYGSDGTSLAEAALAIKGGIKSTEMIPTVDEPEDILFEAVEGKLLVRTHRTRERNAAIIKKKKEAAYNATGQLVCEACGFDFKARYGERGDGFIECHHTSPVSQLKPGQKTKPSDLALLCSNCHRMVHRGKHWLTIDELKALLS